MEIKIAGTDYRGPLQVRGGVPNGFRPAIRHHIPPSELLALLLACLVVCHLHLKSTHLTHTVYFLFPASSCSIAFPSPSPNYQHHAQNQREASSPNIRIHCAGGRSSPPRRAVPQNSSPAAPRGGNVQAGTSTGTPTAGTRERNRRRSQQRTWSDGVLLTGTWTKGWCSLPAHDK
jgi:hypothetical protein